MIKDLLGKMINDCLYLHDSNEGIGIEAVKDDVNSQIYQELKRCVPAKIETLSFMSGDYTAEYARRRNKSIGLHNKAIDQVHKNLKKACGE